MELIKLGVYVAGWVVAARLVYAGMLRSEGEHPGVLIPAFLGLLWPLALGLAVVASPFVAIGYLASRGVGRRRSVR